MSVRFACACRGFSLIELLVVISIVSLLIAFLLPGLRQARGVAQSLACLSNLRQYGVAHAQYMADHDDVMVPPLWVNPSVVNNRHNWGLPLSTYLGNTYGGTDWSTKHYSSGANAKAGTVHICPAEPYVDGAKGDVYSTVPTALNSVAYAKNPSGNAWRYKFTTYAMNMYPAMYVYFTLKGNSGTFVPSTFKDLPRGRNMLYPSDQFMFGEGFPTGSDYYFMAMSASFLSSNVNYKRVNFERHSWSVNMAHLDGHARNYRYDADYPYDTRFGIVARNATQNEAKTKETRNWGWGPKNMRF